MPVCVFVYICTYIKYIFVDSSYWFLFVLFFLLREHMDHSWSCTLIVFWDTVLIKVFLHFPKPQWGQKNQTNKTKSLKRWRVRCAQSKNKKQKRNQNLTYRQVLSPTILQSTDFSSSHFCQEVTSAGQVWKWGGWWGVRGWNPLWGSPSKNSQSSQKTSCESKQTWKHENGQQHKRNSCAARTLLKNLRRLSLLLKRGRWPAEPQWRGGLSVISSVTLLS